MGKPIENHQPVEVDRGRLQPSSMPVEGEAERPTTATSEVWEFEARAILKYIVYI